MLGLIALRLAVAAGMEPGDARAENFINVMRYRLIACIQHLRLKLDRAGGRDVLEAVMATQEGCRTVLELFLSGGESQPSSEPVTLVRRALRTVEGRR